MSPNVKMKDDIQIFGVDWLSINSLYFQVEENGDDGEEETDDYKILTKLSRMF